MCIINFYIIQPNLVTTESIEPVKPVKVRCLSKRLLFGFSFITFIILIVVLAAKFSIAWKKEESDDEKWDPEDYHQNLSDHKVYSRTQWGGRPPQWIDELEKPVQWVIISHTVTTQCKTFAECSNQMRMMQDMHVNDGSPNIGYNFVIGGDANVYEGRGWFAKNFHRFSGDSLAISFTGNYVYDSPTFRMMDVLTKLLALGVDLKVLHPDYRLIAHNQTLNTLSPGVNLYKELKSMDHFYFDMRPRNALNEDK